MTEPTIVFLPGMHGTDALAARFFAALPLGMPRRAMAYPTNVFLNYAELVDRIVNELAGVRSMVLVGESYSGPLAVWCARRLGGRVAAVVLSATFVRPPYWRGFRPIVRAGLFWLPIPAWAIRFLVAGRDASPAFVNEIRAAIRSPSPAVLAGRARDVLTVDCSDALKKCPAPVLSLIPTRDHMVWPWNRAVLLAARPDVTVVELDGPHLILQHSPVAAWQAIESFLKDARL